MTASRNAIHAWHQSLARPKTGLSAGRLPAPGTCFTFRQNLPKACGARGHSNYPQPPLALDSAPAPDACSVLLTAQLAYGHCWGFCLLETNLLPTSKQSNRVIHVNQRKLRGSEASQNTGHGGCWCWWSDLDLSRRMHQMQGELLGLDKGLWLHLSSWCYFTIPGALSEIN